MQVVHLNTRKYEGSKMVSWIILIVGLVTSWHFTDLEAASAWQGLVSPLIFGIFLILTVVRLVILAGPSSHRGGGRGDGGGVFIGSGSGQSSDNGCSGDGGGCD